MNLRCDAAHISMRWILICAENKVSILQLFHSKNPVTGPKKHKFLYFPSLKSMILQVCPRRTPKSLHQVDACDDVIQYNTNLVSAKIIGTNDNEKKIDKWPCYNNSNRRNEIQMCVVMKCHQAQLLDWTWTRTKTNQNFGEWRSEFRYYWIAWNDF